MINLGYACINLSLSDEGITTSRGMINRTYREKGVAHASLLALQNVKDLVAILKWNVLKGISVFRVTSALIPWASEYQLESLPHFSEIRSVLEEAGRLPVRLSMHPGPFNKLAGAGSVLQNTISDLELHSTLFDLMGLTASHWNKINIHVGGAYGDKGATIDRFAQNFSLLSHNLRKRLTVENDDKAGLYSVADLLPLHEQTGIPVVLDYFHHRLHPGSFTEEEAFHAAFATWNVKPVFHFSSSRRIFEDPLARREAHADFIYERINTYDRSVDIVLEAKMKEKALLQYVNEFAGGVQK